MIMLILNKMHPLSHGRMLQRKDSVFTKGAFNMAELIITAANFENEVMHSEKPILIDFYADWCGPCQMLAPVVHEIAKENAGVIKVGKINVDEQMELARKFRVFSIPTLVLFKEGKAVSSLVGFHGKEEIEEMLKSAK